MPLQTTSTGIKSASKFPLQCIVLITPFPAPINNPVGPLRLSTHPGIGSCHAATTEMKVTYLSQLDLHNNNDNYVETSTLEKMTYNFYHFL